MRINSKLLSVVFVASSFPLISVGSAQASEMCTVKTAKQSVSSNTLCACDVVSSRMVRYIQRRADFESILEQTLLDCPAFASVLTDTPTASVGFAEQRNGDGSDNENGGDGFNEPPDAPEPEDKPDPKSDPDPTPPGPTTTGGGGPGSETPKGGGGPGSESPKDPPTGGGAKS
ncbi:hypothetical protein [uncultured Ruegeria sp.]|uniref:hypothetical protein n=1 Tax=uncultured Ruegeria sp. TaxID=259304 RepID=UPI002610E922|nr:hypothetical protein [uncultured Ruegeria sp.]